MYLISFQRSGLGYSSIHNIRGVIRPAFQMAVDDDMILKNPFDFEMSSVLINDSNKREALSPQDQKRFLEFVKNDNHYSKYYDAFLFLFSTGLRISDFFVLPSSCHEVLIVPREEGMLLSDFENMVKEVNSTQVSREDKLSDHVYLYDAKAKELVRADKAMDWEQEKENAVSQENSIKSDLQEEKADRKRERVSIKEKLPQMKKKSNCPQKERERIDKM